MVRLIRPATWGWMGRWCTSAHWENGRYAGWPVRPCQQGREFGYGILYSIACWIDIHVTLHCVFETCPKIWKITRSKPKCNPFCTFFMSSYSPRLQSSFLTEKSCPYLASALTSQSSILRTLQLSDNNLLDSGVNLLCPAFCHQNCKVEKLQ